MPYFNNKLLFSEMLKRGWSATDLAKAAGLSTITVLNLLKGKAKATIKTIAKIAKALNIPGEQLVKWEGV